MSERLTQKEIKHDIREDEVLHYINQTLGWVIANFRKLLAGVAALVVLVLLVVFWGHLQDKKNDAASKALGDAIRIVQAPILEVGATPDDADTPSFPDEASRGSKAKTLLEVVRNDYSGTGPAYAAAVHLGRLELEAGNPEGARTLWNEYLKNSDDDMVAISVKVGLLTLDRDAGNGDAVLTELQGELENSRALLPRDIALYQLGLTFEELDRADEALETFRRLGDEHPESPFARRAQAKIRELETSV